MSGFTCCEECQQCPLSRFRSMRDIAEHQINLRAENERLAARVKELEVTARDLTTYMRQEWSATLSQHGLARRVRSLEQLVEEE